MSDVPCPPAFAGMALIDAETVRAVGSVTDAADALEDALRGGFDPEDDEARVRVSTPAGVLLVMPSALGGYSGTKLLSQTDDNAERGLPLLQGVYVLFGGPGQEPLALLDGIALTELRTPAVSILGIRHLAPAPAGPERLLVCGTGLQARAHVAAAHAERDLAEIVIAGVEAGAAERLAADLAAKLGLPVRGVDYAHVDDAVAAADLICCCTAAREPLFDGSLVRDGAVVVAMGSHFPDTREVDDALIARANVVVESRTGVFAEAGDVMIPLASGVLREEDVLTLHDVVTGTPPPGSGPRFFKTTGMPWEDLVVATSLARSVASAATSPSTPEHTEHTDHTEVTR